METAHCAVEMSASSELAMTGSTVLEMLLLQPGHHRPEPTARSTHHACAPIAARPDVAARVTVVTSPVDTTWRFAQSDWFVRNVSAANSSAVLSAPLASGRAARLRGPVVVRKASM